MIYPDALSLLWLANIPVALWVVWDARRRRRSGWLQGLLVFIFGFPLGVIGWFIARPKLAR